MFRRFAFRAAAAAFGARARGTFSAAKFARTIASVSTLGTAALLAAPLLSAEASSVDIAALRKDIAAAIDADDSLRANGTSIGPTLVRYDVIKLIWFRCFLSPSFIVLLGMPRELMMLLAKQAAAMVPR